MAHLRCARWLQVSLVVFITSHFATVVQAASLNEAQFQHYLPDGYLIIPPENLLPSEELIIAQIIPDNTLGNEGSILLEDNNIDRVDGGAIRGGNLFHSFQDFNIDTGQTVYFVNPEGIETILSRVTGSNGSDIDGLLGVAGPADLFLLNPNGIRFGPNAELDILGAFTASTAGTLEFVDGGKFSAANPQGASFLTMSAPLGVQFGLSPQGDIASTGVLETGEDLTLSGNQLYLEGRVIAGDDLTLQAQDTVMIRDTATDAFMARSGDELTIQGNQGIDIWTLQHLEQTPFVSEGDLALISDGVISGDAHFESGGDLRFLTLEGLPGIFVSFHDPIIFADGDVVFGDYTGVALKVEATGSIQAGDIRITGPDTTLMADGSGSDEDLLASSRAAILRAGVDSVSALNVPQTEGGTTFDVGNLDGQPSGSIVVSTIDTSNTDGGDGGPIIVSAGENIIFNGRLDSFSNSTVGEAGKGGSISVSSVSGDILVNEVFLSSSRANEVAGDGGDITLSSGSGNITINDSLSSSTGSLYGSFGNGGRISISSISGDITINEILSSGTSSSTFSTATAVGDGGDILITSISGNITTNMFVGTGTSSNAGVSNGGDITISSVSGDITTNEALISGSNTRSGVDNTNKSGGDISIFSTFGNITSNGVSSASSSLGSGNAASGGDISVFSIYGDITVDRLLSSTSSSESGKAGNGGEISISSTNGNIFVTNTVASASYSLFGATQSGGTISIVTETGKISGDNTNLFSVSLSGPSLSASNGGSINLVSQSSISDLTIFTLSSSGDSGSVNIQGLGDLFIRNLQLVTSGQVETFNPLRPAETIIITLIDVGQSGDTVINSLGDLTLDNVNILGDANITADAGNVKVFSPGNIRFDNSQIFSNTNIDSSGNGGNIFVKATDSITLDNSLINTDTEGSGRAGSIDILTPLLNIQNGVRVTAETSSSVTEGTGGTVSIEADTINLSGNETAISVSTSGPATAGNIILKPNSSDSIDITTVGEGPQISASTGPGSSGAGGNIVIRDADVAKLDNTELVTSGNGSGSAGSILIENVDTLLMRRGSLILAEASDTGGGGNVFIDAGFALTIPEEDNDILATANSGQGGTVDITANLIIGFREVEQFSPTLRGNRISDISASSNSGIDGIVNLDADPNPELTELPTDLADPANRIAQGCSTENRTIADSSTGDFTVTGRGGQLLSPEDIAGEDAPIDDLGPDMIQLEPSTSDAKSSLLINNPPHISLVDAQEAIVTESGEVFLLAEGGWQPLVSCTALR